MAKTKELKKRCYWGLKKAKNHHVSFGKSRLPCEWLSLPVRLIDSLQLSTLDVVFYGGFICDVPL